MSVVVPVMVMPVTAVDVAGWDEDLRVLLDGLGGLFVRRESRDAFGAFVRGLLADVPKKNSWGLAEYAGYATARPLEHLLDEAVWEVDALRDAVRELVVARLGDKQAVVIADDTQVIKKGRMSVGVAPQHCGATGQVENCQVLPMLSYASETGHCFIDRSLYLPEAWADDPARRERAGIPAPVGFATKPALVIDILARVLAADVPFSWFAADAGYGRDPNLREFCHAHQIAYVMAVPLDLPLVGVDARGLRAEDVLRAGGHRWETRSAGSGSKGERVYDWSLHTVQVKDQNPADGYAHHLLIRRSRNLKRHKGKVGMHEIEYFLAHAPAGTPMAAMVRAAGLRWKIEEDNKTTKDQLGLDHYQVRKWTPWHRHVTICMLAAAFLAVTRAGLGKDPRPASQATG